MIKEEYYKKYLLNRILFVVVISIFGMIFYSFIPDIALLTLVNNYNNYMNESNNTVVSLLNVAEDSAHEIGHFLVFIKALVTLILTIFISVIGYMFYYMSKRENDHKELKDLIVKGEEQKLPCMIDEVRKPIIDNYSPDMYIPLKESMINLVSNVRGKINSCNIGCETTTFPFIENENIEFIPKFGYKFNGKNMLTIHSKFMFPKSKEARTFIMAVHPLDIPSDHPMFFFAYGNRKKHKCGDGVNNHGKSFGLFWGEPQPKNGINDKDKGYGIRAFFYCEHCSEDRTSEYCDSPTIDCEFSINKWHVFAISFDGNNVKVYQDGNLKHNQKYDIATAASSYLNIGGFVHHDEDGAIVARDSKYSMNGYITEFMMFRKVLIKDEILVLTKEIKNLIAKY